MARRVSSLGRGSGNDMHECGVLPGREHRKEGYSRGEGLGDVLEAHTSSRTFAVGAVDVMRQGRLAPEIVVFV